MESNKRFYWLKLKTEFINGEVFEALVTQEHGSDFVVIYFQLCTMAINSGGELVTRVGNRVIPYTEEKIWKKCQFFDYYTVSKAISQFMELGLLFKQENGIYKITGFEDMVGSETYWAKQKRKTKRNNDKKKQKVEGVADGVLENFQSPLISVSSSVSPSINEWELHEDDDIPF